MKPVYLYKQKEGGAKFFTAAFNTFIALRGVQLNTVMNKTPRREKIQCRNKIKIQYS